MMQPRIYKMNWFVRLITLGWPVAITLAPVGIYIEPKYFDDPQVRNHESIHWHQQCELWFLGFYVWYLFEWLVRLVVNWKMAYMSVSFEREAYQNDDSPVYWQNRKRFAWLSYLRRNGRFKVKRCYCSGRELIRLRSELNGQINKDWAEGFSNGQCM